jgi:hypothetical protein
MGLLTVIDETHNSLASFTHPKCRARYFAVVADKLSLTQVWVNLHVDRLDVDLIVVKRRAIRVRNGAMHNQSCASTKCSPRTLTILAESRCQT